MSNENTNVDLDALLCACKSASGTGSSTHEDALYLAVAELKDRMDVHCNTLIALKNRIESDNTAAKFNDVEASIAAAKADVTTLSNSLALIADAYSQMKEDIKTGNDAITTATAKLDQLSADLTGRVEQTEDKVAKVEADEATHHAEQETAYKAAIEAAKVQVTDNLTARLDESLENKAQTDAVIYAQRSELNGIYKCHAALMAADNQLQAALNRIESTAADNAYNYARARMNADITTWNEQLQLLVDTYNNIKGILTGLIEEYNAESGKWAEDGIVDTAINAITAAGTDAVAEATSAIATVKETAIGEIVAAKESAVEDLTTEKTSAIDELQAKITEAIGEGADSAKQVLETLIEAAAEKEADLLEKVEVAEDTSAGLTTVITEAKSCGSELKLITTEAKMVGSEQRELITTTATAAAETMRLAIETATEVVKSTINEAVDNSLANAEDEITAAATKFIEDSIEDAKDTISNAWETCVEEAASHKTAIEELKSQVDATYTELTAAVDDFDKSAQDALDEVNTEKQQALKDIENERVDAVVRIQNYANSITGANGESGVFARLSAIESAIGFEDDSDALDTDNTFSIGDEVGATVGFIQKGEVLKNKTIKEILHMLLYPETYATIKSFNLFKNVTEVLEPKLYYKDDFDGAGTSLTAQAAEFEIEFGNVPLITKDADGNEFNRIVVELTRSTNNRESRTIWTKEILAEDIGDNNIGSFSVDLGDFGIITPDSFGDGRYTVDFKVKVIERFSGVKKEKHSSNVVNSFIFEDPRAAMFCGVVSIDVLTPSTGNGWLAVTNDQFLNDFTKNSNNSVVYLDDGSIPGGTTPYMTFSGDTATLNYQVPATNGASVLLVLYPESVCNGITQVKMTEGGETSFIEGGFTNIKPAGQVTGQNYIDIGGARYAIWGTQLGTIFAENTSIEIKFNAN